ncbi:hypothetical protein ACFGVR_04730 [Mucilaginibacter sp. AW1-3]
MNKIHYLLLLIVSISLNSCFVIGAAVKLGYEMGVLVFRLKMFSAFIILGLIIWVLIKRTQKRK